MEDNLETLTIDWIQRTPCSIPRYRTPNHKAIYDVSFGASPDVLYILTKDNEIFSLSLSTLTFTKMVINGLERVYGRSSHGIDMLVYHNEYIYIMLSTGTVYKCIIEESALEVTSWYSHGPQSTRMWRMLTISETGLLYHCDGRSCLSIIDTHTMEHVRSSKYLLCYKGDMAITQDQLHIANVRGVHIYTTDGVYTGQSYLCGMRCVSITCTNNGYNIVGMMEKVAVVSSNDLTSIYYISTTSVCRPNYYHVTCNAVDNSLAMWDYDTGYLLLVPQEVYQPPFSLFALCMSTVLNYEDQLPISLLSPRIYKQLLMYKNKLTQ